MNSGHLGSSQEADGLALQALRERKTELLRQVDRVEARSAELQRQARMYMRATLDLGEKMAQADIEAHNSDLANEPHTAAHLRRLSETLRVTIERNARLADARECVALQLEEQTQRHRATLRSLDKQIEIKMEVLMFGDREWSRDRLAQFLAVHGNPPKGEEAYFYDIVSTGSGYARAF